MTFDLENDIVFNRGFIHASFYRQSCTKIMIRRYELVLGVKDSLSFNVNKFLVPQYGEIHKLDLGIYTWQN